jgi:hypothetical protein
MTTTSVDSPGPPARPLAPARPFFTYVATLVGLDSIIYTASNAAQTLELVDATRGFLLLGAILGAFLLPAATLTIHVVARLGTTPAVVRAILGMVSWTGWYLFVAAAVVVAGTIGIWPEGFVALLVVLGVAGAVFAVLGVSASPVPPRRIVTVLAGVIGALIIAGCFVTVGWWGEPT